MSNWFKTSSNSGEDLKEKKLLGSGGYTFAKLTEQEEIKAGLGIPQIFLVNIGRLSEARFTRYVLPLAICSTPSTFDP